MGGTKLDKQYTKLQTIKPKNLLEKAVQSQPKWMFKGSMKAAETTTGLINKVLPKSKRSSFFKMKGFSGFGNSPVKKLDKPKTQPLTESEKRGQSNYDSNTKKIQFTGSEGTRQSTKFAPVTPKQAKQEKEAIANQKKRQNQSRIKRVVEGVATGGTSEVVRKIRKSDIAKKIVKSLKNTPPFKR